VAPLSDATETDEQPQALPGDGLREGIIDDLRRRIGFLPTNPTFPRSMTPISYLQFVGNVVGIPTERTKIRLATLLQAVDLTQVASQKIESLSTGMVTRLGIAAALMTMRELGGGDLASAAPMEKLPQTLVNVEVTDREAIAAATAVWEAVERESAGLEGRGRVLLRPSGTEPLVRVMAEAPSAEEAEAVCKRLAELVRDQLG